MKRAEESAYERDVRKWKRKLWFCRVRVVKRMCCCFYSVGYWVKVCKTNNANLHELQLQQQNSVNLTATTTTPKWRRASVEQAVKWLGSQNCPKVGLYIPACDIWQNGGLTATNWWRQNCVVVKYFIHICEMLFNDVSKVNGLRIFVNVRKYFLWWRE